jgi:hypothetical protein
MLQVEGETHVESPMAWAPSRRGTDRRSNYSEALIKTEPTSPNGVPKTAECHTHRLVRYTGM